MSLHGKIRLAPDAARPIVLEFAAVTAALVGVFLWNRVVTASLSAAFGSPPDAGGFVLYGAGHVVLTVAGLAAFAGAYAAVRGISVGLSLPSRADLPFVGTAVGVPLALVGLTKLVGVLTDVPYNSLTKSSYGADAPLLPILVISGLGLVVAVPSLVVVCQVLVQGSFRRVLGGNEAVVLTAVTAGFLMTSSVAGLAIVPEAEKLVGAGLFALALGVALAGAERVARPRVRSLTYVPALLFVALVVASGVAEIGTVAEALFAATHLAVFGVAAYAYDRTDSLVVPALAYATVSLANDAVVLLFEAGLQSW